MKSNNFKIKSLHLLIGGISAMMLSSLGDFQNADVYQSDSNINSWVPSIHVVKQFDRYKKEIPSNWEKISFIQEANPWAKMSLALTSVGLTVASIILHGQEQENQDIEEYEKSIEKDKRRAIADDKRARFEIYLDQKSEVEQVKDIQELMKNDPIAREILEHRQRIELGIIDDEDVNHNPNDDLIPEHMLVDVEIPNTPPSPSEYPVELPDVEEEEEEEEENKKKKQSWLTEKQITRLKILLQSGTSLSDALKKVVPEFKPDHPNWEEIKKELFERLI